MTADEVRHFRISFGYSRRDFARLLGAPYETICRWENGDRSPSPLYQTKIRETFGQKGFAQSEEHWVFWEPNLRSVEAKMASSDTIILGTLHAPYDPSHRYYFATVRLDLITKSILELSNHVTKAKDQGKSRTRLVGFFIGGNNKRRPLEGPVSMMLAGSVVGANHCALFDRETKRFTLWKLRQESELIPYQDPTVVINYSVIGGRE